MRAATGTCEDCAATFTQTPTGPAYTRCELCALLRRVDPDAGRDECWRWLGAIKSNGYGNVGRRRCEGGGWWMPHRLIYALLNGPIPEGMTLDHGCSVRACCNPGHLEPVTFAENLRRGRSTRITGAQADAIRGDYRHAEVIAAEHGIGADHVRSIRAGRAWGESTYAVQARALA